jgi:selenoprotein W-related protein
MAKRPIKVTIAYCSECGYEPQTLKLAETLMKEFRHELSAVEIVPFFEGTFEVAVDGELVHSMEREGGFGDPAKVIAAVKRHQQVEAEPD